MNYFENHILFFSVIAIGITFILSITINLIFLKFSQTLGIRQRQHTSQREIRWSPTAKPSIGGISFFVIFLISFIGLNFINHILPFQYDNLKIVGIFLVSTLAFLMGLADDAYNTQPLLKFMAQLLCGLILYFTGTKISIFSNETFNFTLTVFWIIGFMNSINMLDNMDGITTIVSILILTFFILVNHKLNLIMTPIPILCLGILGSLFGFLVYNWHPAKMFMGDTGSQFLGAFLGAIGIDYCWNFHTLTNNVPTAVHPILLGFTIISLVFILPITDTLSVTINRLLKGQSPFVGGKDHTTHFLFFRGITEKRIALLFLAIGAIGLYLAINLIFSFQFHMFLISIGFCMLVFLSLYFNTIIKKK